MNYELIDAVTQGSPIVTDEGGVVTVGVYVNVTAGIVGDTYGFTKTTTEYFTIATDSIIYAKNQIPVLAAQKVAELYPNT